MKKFLPILLLIIGLTTTTQAQWTSPGEGTTYTFADLVNITNGVVTTGENGFVVNADLTISSGDNRHIDKETTRKQKNDSGRAGRQGLRKQQGSQQVGNRARVSRHRAD